MNNQLIESGEQITMEECRRCGASPARGTEFIRAGIRIFKCEDCGKSMNNGYLEESHKKQLEGRIGHEKATENRDRFWRENQQLQEEQFKRKKDIPGEAAEEVWNIDYALRKPQF